MQYVNLFLILLRGRMNPAGLDCGMRAMFWEEDDGKEKARKWIETAPWWSHKGRTDQIKNIRSAMWLPKALLKHGILLDLVVHFCNTLFHFFPLSSSFCHYPPFNQRKLHKPNQLKMACYLLKLLVFYIIHHHAPFWIWLRRRRGLMQKQQELTTL